MSKRAYILSIDAIYDSDSGDLLLIYSKGHHDFALFMDALTQEFEPEKAEKPWTPKVDYIRHSHMRVVYDFAYECMMAHEPVKAGRGAFPVTVYDRFEQYLAEHANNLKNRQNTLQ